MSAFVFFFLHSNVQTRRFPSSDMKQCAPTSICPPSKSHLLPCQPALTIRGLGLRQTGWTVYAVVDIHNDVAVLDNLRCTQVPLCRKCHFQTPVSNFVVFSPSIFEIHTQSNQTQDLYISTYLLHVSTDGFISVCLCDSCLSPKIS